MTLMASYFFLALYGMIYAEAIVSKLDFTVKPLFWSLWRYGLPSAFQFLFGNINAARVGKVVAHNFHSTNFFWLP